MNTQNYDEASNAIKTYSGSLIPRKITENNATGIEFDPFTLNDVATFFSDLSGEQLSDYIPADYVNVLKNIKITSEDAINGKDAKKGLTLLKTQSGFLLTFAIQFTKKWEIIAGVASIQNSYLALKISRQSVNGVSKVSVSGVICSGDITFNKVALDLKLTAKVPSFILIAELSSTVDPQKTQNHQAIANQYLGSLKKAPNDTLVVEDIRLTAAPLLKNYALHLAVDNVLNLHGKFTVKKFQADLNFSGGNAASYSVLAWTEIAIGFQKNPIDIILVAERKVKKGVGDSWKFSGSLGHPVTFGEMMADLGALFSIDSKDSYHLPDTIADIVLEKLGLSFEVANDANGASKKFSFVLELKLPLDGKELDLTVKAHYTKDNEAYSLVLEGDLMIAGRSFDVIFKKISDPKKPNTPLSNASIFEAKYKSKNDKIDLTELLASVTGDPELTKILPDVSIKLDEVLFAVFKGGNNANKYLFGLELEVDLDLSALPVVGKIMKSQGSYTYGIKNFKFFLASQPFFENEIRLFPKDDADFILGGSTTGSQSNGATPIPVLTKGPNFRATLNLGGITKVIPRPAGQVLPGAVSALPAGTAAPGLPGGPAMAAGGSPSDSQAQWINIQQSIGPLTFERIGVTYKEGKFWFFISASFTASGLTIELDGLGIGMSIPTKGKKLSVDPKLMGMSLGFESGPIGISGGFVKSNALKDPHGHDAQSYAGEVLIKAEPFTISAFGMYSSSQDLESFFAFAMLDIPLGGPPIFYVTGLAAGFGYNSRINIPPIEKMSDYLLVKSALPPPPGGTNPLAGKQKNPGTVLNDLVTTKPPAVQMAAGEEWIGVGVRFTSYELIQSFALLTVSFGHQFELAILGRSQISIPTGAPTPIAFAEIDLEVIIIPDAVMPTPILAVDARLSDTSHIFSPDCRLMGGFAFHIWPNNDFVVTLGGYHPHFQLPAYYPRVDRLGISWQLSNVLIVKGQLYFALTPSAVMAGGGLQAVFNAGPIRAWFIAEANFLMSWKPFHYEASIRIALGISVDLGLFTISIHLGVGLELWGPEFGGIATIDLNIVSFSISFGAGKPTPPPLSWEEFAESFLPKGNNAPAHGMHAMSTSRSAAPPPQKRPSEVVSGMVSKGLIKNDDTYGAVLNPHNFELMTNTAVPATDITVNGSNVDENKLTSTLAPGETWIKEVGIIPMQVTGVASKHNIVIKRIEEGSNKYKEYKPALERLDFRGIWKEGPQSLWKNQARQDKKDQLAAQTTIPGMLVGVSITPKKLKAEQTKDIDVTSLKLELEKLIGYEDFPAASASLVLATPAASLNAALSSIGQHLNSSKSNRAAILAALGQEGFALSENLNATRFSVPATEALDESPVFIQ